MTMNQTHPLVFFSQFFNCLLLLLPLAVRADSEIHFEQGVWSEEVHSHEVCSSGTFKCGMHYAIQQSQYLDHALLITLRIPASTSGNNHFLFHLLQHSMFNGCAAADRSAIEKTLKDLSMDINIDNNIVFNDLEQSLRFSLCDRSYDKVIALLTLIMEIISSPDLTDEGIELARNHMFATLGLTCDEQLTLRDITAMQVRKAYEEWFPAERLVLVVSDVYDNQEFVNIISQIFNPVIDWPSCDANLIAAKKQPCEFEEGELEARSWGWSLGKKDFHIEHLSNGTCVIDGKIKMKEPKGLEKKSNGYALSALMIVLGVSTAAFSAIFFAGAMTAPIFLWALSIASVGSGLYFACTKYINDPKYIAALREKDLQKGSLFAYKKGYIRYTLTPLERRVMLIQELLSPDSQILPISILMSYQLGDPVIYELFTLDEYNLLSQIKNEAISQSNIYRELINNLEDELINITTPHTLLRDQRIEYARLLYEGSHPLINDRLLKGELRKREEQLNKLKCRQSEPFEESPPPYEEAPPPYKEAPPPPYDADGRDHPPDYSDSCQNYDLAYPGKNVFLPSYRQDSPPSYEEAAGMDEKILTQQISYYKKCLEANEVALNLIKENYELEVIRARQDYTTNVEACKQQIDYYAKIAEYKGQMKNGLLYYSRKLQDLLIHFPANPLGLPDYIDRTH